ncbi:rod shape-determining protein MreC [Alkalinema pantanalense CENA528]|uniref:rod shape-determining protein MreC n=1 Tax=Alkalinema pantanalense TaxID=1620705 RepID=UPI003D6E7505
MFTVRRWWERYGTQTLLIGLAIGTAAIVRQTQGIWLMETYQGLTRPFQGDPNQAAVQIENAQVLELQQRLIELQNRNQRLEELLGLVQGKKPEALPAPVIGRSADHWWQQVILGRGSQDGVQVNSVVMAPGGVVGRVSQVSNHASRVVLLSDAANQVGVTVSRSRATGYMKGQTGENAGTQVIMQFFDKVPDVRKGDTVVTSAFSSKFPAGLPVGRIESIDLSKSPAPEAIIQLTAPISSLEWVAVYPPGVPNQADALPNPEPSPSSSFAPSPSPSAQP